MFAVIKTGGKQYPVEIGTILKIEKIEGKKGDVFSFNQVLIIGNETKQTLGTPYIKGASVKGKILNQIRDKKIIVFKKRRRKNYRSTQGHRQFLTVIKIDKILTSSVTETKEDKKISLPKEKNVKKQTINKETKSKKKVVSNKEIKKKTVSKKTAKKKVTKDK